MAETSIHDFSAQFKGGVRANLFKCTVSPPTHRAGVEKMFSFHCKGTSMPASNIGNIDVPYRGRQLKVPGDRTFADWTTTVFNDRGMYLRGVFEEWMGMLQDHWENKQANINPYGSGKVEQLARDGTTIRTYNITSMYPTEVAAIDVAWDSNDAVEEYAVTFAVNHWIAGTGSRANASGGDPEFGIEVSADSSGKLGASIWGSISNR